MSEEDGLGSSGIQGVAVAAGVRISPHASAETPVGGPSIRGLKQQRHLLRARMLEQRAALAPVEVLARSRRVYRRLAALAPYRSSRAILFYMALPQEVQTREMVLKALQQGKGVALPVVLPGEKGLRLHLVTDLDGQLSPGPYGILQPRSECGALFDLAQVDLVIVPGLAFDGAGRRLGFGQGYYDRLLSGVHPRTVTIGLAYAFQVVDRIPVLAHDRAVHYVVTDERVFRCRP